MPAVGTEQTLGLALAALAALARGNRIGHPDAMLDPRRLVAKDVLDPTEHQLVATKVELLAPGMQRIGLFLGQRLGAEQIVGEVLA